MADRPILFSAPMVRALLAGTKTQTRRMLKPQPTGHVWRYGWSKEGGATFSSGDELISGRIPIWAGDRLWVRESWSGMHQFRDTPPAQRESFATPDGPVLRDDVWFWADGSPTGGDYERPRPGIHMPRWASRLTLTVTDVRVERLQDISEQDAVAEGIEAYGGIDANCSGYLNYRNNSEDGYWMPATKSYASLWDKINGDGAWEASPWIVAYTFTVTKQNIDQLDRRAA